MAKDNSCVFGGNVLNSQAPSENKVQEIVKLLSRQEYTLSLIKARALLQEFKQFSMLYSIIGSILFKLKDDTLAYNSFRRSIILEPTKHQLYNNFAAVCLEQNNFDEAKKLFAKTLKIEPYYKQAYYHLGNIFQNLGNIELAIEYYKRAIKIDPTYQLAKYFLGNALIELGKFEDASKTFSETDFRDSRSREVEALYCTQDTANFYEKYSKLTKDGLCNPIIGAVGCHASLRFQCPIDNTFCRKPLDYVSQSLFCNNIETTNYIRQELQTLLSKDAFEMRQQPIVNMGWQTSGNLFSRKESIFAFLEESIVTEIERYLQLYKSSSEGFIKAWPKKLSLKAWLIGLRNEGFLASHIHRDSWISGSIYLHIPKKSKVGDGDLVVTLHGAEFPSLNQEIPKRNIDVQTGDICIFPSSLFHYTQPISSDEERLVLAFDVKNNQY